MSDTTDSVDVVAVAKTVGKVVTKELAYQAGIHVAALSILMGVGYTYHVITERRNKKAAQSTTVEQ